MILRDYQQEAVDGLWDWFRANPTGNPLIAMPTGTGKSAVAAAICATVARRWAGNDVLVLTHVKELIEQNSNTFGTYATDVEHGVFSAGLGRRDFHKPVMFAGIQSIHNRPELFQKTSIVIVDEAHLVPDTTTTMYRKFLDGLAHPHLRVVGLTATPFRTKVGHLTNGGLFTDIAVDMTTPAYFQKFIREGYLCPLVPRAPEKQIVLDDLVTRMGDYVAEDIERALDAQGIMRSAVEEALVLAGDRKSWLIFVPSLAYGDRLCKFMNALDIKTGFVHSKMPDKERDAEILKYKRGQYRAIINKDILTTGFDDPKTDCILMLRPTKSPGLHVQMLGRGTRPHPSKKDCLVLDFAQNAATLGPIDNPTLPSPPKPKIPGAPRPMQPITVTMKVCPQCRTYCVITAAECTCGHLFPVVAKHSRDADVAPLMSGGLPTIPPVWYAVDRIHIEKYQAISSGKWSMRVTYMRNRKELAHEYLCFGSKDSFVKKMAREQWLALEGSYPIPETIEGALLRVRELTVPVSILIDRNGKHPVIRNRTC